MPTYEYKCENCEHFFETFQPITANPLKKCPQCGKSKLNRLIGTGAGIIFKGSGFYETDYRSESYKSGAKTQSPTTPATTDSKTETKSEPKTESKPTENKTPAKKTT